MDMAHSMVFDEDERAMGIVAFRSPDDLGFDAVLKARYADFVVREVGRDGKLAQLESLEVPTPSDMKPPPIPNEPSTVDYRKRKQPDGIETEKTTLAEDEEAWKTTALSKLSESVGSDCAERTIAMLRYWGEQSADADCNDKIHNHGKHVTMPALADKQARRSLHELVRSTLSSCALADTQDGRVRIWHRRFEKDMPNYGKFDRNDSGKPRKPKPQWPSDRPDFLQFVLYKENVDTSVATKEVVRRLSHGGNRKIRIGYAGMKDKRGVTSQFCTLYRQDPSALLRINQEGQGGGNTTSGRVSVIRVGNFRFVPTDIQMGMLKGNRFDIALRNVEVQGVGGSEEGTLETDADRISRTKQSLEKAAQSFRKSGFVNYFGMQRFGKYCDTHKVGIAILKGDFEGAVNIIMEPKPDEQARSAKGRDVWARRFDTVDKADNDIKIRAQAECSSSRETLKYIGRFMTCEVAILNSLIRKPLDYKRAFCCIPKGVRLLFLHALQSYIWNRVATERIDTLGQDIVEGDLVLVGDKGKAFGGSGTSGLGGKTVKVVDSGDISSGKFAATDMVLPLVGTKITYPENDSGSHFEKVLLELGLGKEQFGKVQDRELNVGGDYRKLICLPGEVEFEVLEYNDPLQPLLKTELMRLNGESLERNQTPHIDSNPSMLAIVVGFTLPPSSYATIALREFMKRPTSGRYQSQVRLERPSTRIENN